MERSKRDRSRSPVHARDKDREKHRDRRDRDIRDRDHKSHGETSTDKGPSPRDKSKDDHRQRDAAPERRHHNRNEQEHIPSGKINRHQEPDRDTRRQGYRDDRIRDNRRDRDEERDERHRDQPPRGRGGQGYRDRGNQQRYMGREDRDQRRDRGPRGDNRIGAEQFEEYTSPAGEEASQEQEGAAPAEEPNYELSGKLTEYANSYKGVVIKYNEPPESRKPNTRWRLYPFKGEESMPVMYIHRQSAYLLGRQRHIADIPIDHPSCSKQHAIIQYRLVDHEKPDGTMGRRVKPYVLDLESANGTFLNNQKIEPRRYYELKERDVLKFGFSSREYVLLHEKSSKGEEAEATLTDSNSSAAEDD